MPKSTKAKFSPGKVTRRHELRRNLPKPTLAAWDLLRRPEIVSAELMLLLFIAIAGTLVVWGREQILVLPGQVMTDTRLNRLDFKVVDEDATEALRREEREEAPDVYTLDADYVEGLGSPLRNLPVVVAQQTELESISPEILERFALDAASLSILAAYADADGKPTANWIGWVDRLLAEGLVRHPIVPNEAWQRGLLAPEPPQVRGVDDTIAADWRDAITISADEDDSELRDALRDVARSVGFPTSVTPYIVAGLASVVQPTYLKNEELTNRIAADRAERVAEVEIEHTKGDVIYGRGDRLSPEQLARLGIEAERYRAAGTVGAIWLPRVGLIGLIAVLLTLAGAFVLTFYPRIVRNKLRAAAIGLLMSGMLLITVVLASQVTQLLFPIAIATTLFVAVVLLLAYDQRLALFFSAVQCALVTLALGQQIGWFILILAGCGTMISQLREVRHRKTLIRAGLVTAVVLGAGTILLGLFASPATDGIRLQILGQAAWAVVAAAVVGFLILGILPSVERLFDITTGMTLAELRDPSQPLLRQLQQRAPGTYNHSLQVANIAEAAADAIGADALMVYVGALYHDIGKMNKPEYFIENQAGGFNKHTKLRPAMSLLVIIGHVKDGIELAREYALPRAIQHFIEAHHGTTLVEYFYHAARTEAEADDRAPVDEIEFRYPGPRPSTKEAAILMLADAVESATRTMTEPNPGRIESLVRELSRKRLLDSQFDECDLTFRELGLIEDAMIARMCAIHHGRIAYPSAKSEEQTTDVVVPAEAS